MSDIPPPPSFGGPINDSPANPYVAPAVVSTPKRRRKGIAVALAGILAVGGVGMAGYQFLSGDGASSPEAALDRLTEAISNEDLLGAIDALAPEERATFTDPARRMNSELKRIGVLSSSMDLSSVPGVDLEIKDLRTERTQVHSDLMVLHVTGGTMRASGDLDEVPLGSGIRATMDEFMGKDEPLSGEVEEDLADADLRIATVRRDGGWYVSLWYSVAESARRSAGKDAPRPEDAIPARGADSPEAAVYEMVKAAADDDPRRVIELVDPQEGRVLHEYGPLLLEGPEATERPSEASVERLDLRAERRGNRASVYADAIKIVEGTGARAKSLEYDGECVVFIGPGHSGEVEEDRVCAGDADPSSLFGKRDSTFLAMFEAFSISTVEVDGAWYVSPIGTVADLMLRGLAAVEDNAVDTLLDDMESFFEELGQSFIESAESGFGEGFDSDFDRLFGEDFMPRTGEDEGSNIGKESGDAPAGDDDLYGVCTGLVDDVLSSTTLSQVPIDAAATCVAELLESGELQPYMVPDRLLAPTCGLDIVELETLVDEAMFSDEIVLISELLAKAESVSRCVAIHHPEVVEDLMLPTSECLLIWEEQARDNDAYFECFMNQ